MTMEVVEINPMDLLQSFPSLFLLPLEEYEPECRVPNNYIRRNNILSSDGSGWMYRSMYTPHRSVSNPAPYIRSPVCMDLGASNIVSGCLSCVLAFCTFKL